LGWSSNFLGSESGQIPSVKTRAEYGLQHPLPSAHCLYLLYFDTGEEEGRRLELYQREG
jgi:hypothetical protein